MSSDQSVPVPIQRLLDVYPSFALLAGLRLEVFTCLKDGPLSAAQVAAALGVEPERLQVLLCAGDPSATQAVPIWRRVDAHA